MTAEGPDPGWNDLNPFELAELCEQIYPMISETRHLVSRDRLTRNYRGGLARWSLHNLENLFIVICSRLYVRSSLDKGVTRKVTHPGVRVR